MELQRLQNSDLDFFACDQIGSESKQKSLSPTSLERKQAIVQFTQNTPLASNLDSGQRSSNMTPSGKSYSQSQRRRRNFHRKSFTVGVRPSMFSRDLQHTQMVSNFDKLMSKNMTNTQILGNILKHDEFLNMNMS